MKYIKTYENYYGAFNDYNIEDYVIVMRAYSTSKIKNGEKCKIVSLDLYGNGEYVVIENENGVREAYIKNRIIPELVYFTNKYNL